MGMEKFLIWNWVVPDLQVFLGICRRTDRILKIPTIARFDSVTGDLVSLFVENFDCRSQQVNTKGKKRKKKPE